MRRSTRSASGSGRSDCHGYGGARAARDRTVAGAHRCAAYTARVRAVRRLLDVVRRELDALDARLEIGGAEPRDPTLVWCDLDADVRLVARFAEPPDHREDAVHRLRTIAEAFAQTVQESIDTVTREVAVKRPAARRALADALSVLADHARAVVALVIDVHAPVIWGSSDYGLQLADVDEALQLAEDHARARAAGLDPGTPAAAVLEQPDDRALARSVARLRARWSDNPAAARRDLVTARAIAWCRKSDRADVLHIAPDHGVLVRGFAGIYRLVLAFDGPFSELIAEPITRRALPVIERLVSELPPHDPTPEAARVVPLRRE